MTVYERRSLWLFGVVRIPGIPAGWRSVGMTQGRSGKDEPPLFLSRKYLSRTLHWWTSGISGEALPGRGSRKGTRGWWGWLGHRGDGKIDSLVLRTTKCSTLPRVLRTPTPSDAPPGAAVTVVPVRRVATTRRSHATLADHPCDSPARATRLGGHSAPPSVLFIPEGLAHEEDARWSRCARSSVGNAHRGYWFGATGTSRDREPAPSAARSRLSAPKKSSYFPPGF